MLSTLTLIRGVSGSGKTTLARLLARELSAVHYETDDYFEQSGGVYVFDPAKLKDAHDWNQGRVAMRMQYFPTIPIIVANTFTRHWELQPYLALAHEHRYDVQTITVKSNLSPEQLAERNVHGLTAAMIQKQLSRWED